MRKNAFILLLLVLLVPLLIFAPEKTQGADLGALVRIDSLSPSQASGGTVCATPSSTGIETAIQVVFPTGFTVNSTASNWTVTTTNLPSGSVALPGIGTATAVSGQTVTFPSDDLTSGTEYCFNFDSTNTLTTPSSTGTYVGILRTHNNSGNVIDYHAFGISIISSNAISVTAKVGAVPSDYQASLVKTAPTGTTFHPGTIITYQFTYGDTLPYATNIILEAEWSRGTVEGDVSPSEDVVSYVNGSASDGYNGTKPIIDIQNHKVIWTINGFPGNTSGKTVTFQLKTADSAPSELNLTSFNVAARIVAPDTTSADSTVTSYYVYPPIGPTNTPGPNNTSTTSSTTPTSTSTQQSNQNAQLTIYGIDINTISSSSSSILVRTNKDSKVKVNYGTVQNNLSQQVSDNSFSANHTIALVNLKPNTRYYFKVSVTDTSGSTVVSDFYFLDTAIVSTPPKLIPNSLVVTSGDVLLTDFVNLNGKLPNIILPVNTPYSFRLAVDLAQNIKSVKAILRSSSVLGASTVYPDKKEYSFDVTEISPGQYIGRLDSPIDSGKYALVIQLSDYDGNITEQTAANLFIVEPFAVINSVTKEGVENAKATIYYYNVRLRKYDIISTKLTSITNPVFSGPNGILQTVLPEGKYKVEFSVLGYKNETVEFTLGPDSPNYPQIKLTPLPFSIAVYATFLWGVLNDTVKQLVSNIHGLTESNRNFALFSFITMSLFVFVTAFSTARKFSVPILLLPYFSFYHLTLLFHKPKHTFIVHGKVMAALSDEIVPGATLYMSHPSGHFNSHTTTNGYGEFLAKINEARDLRITISKQGFKNFSQIVHSDKLNDKITLEVERLVRPSFSLNNLLWYFYFFAGALFETFLILTLILELVFAKELGITVLPFILLSVLNIIFWTANIKSLKSS